MQDKKLLFVMEMNEKKLCFNKHFRILYVYAHLNIYARILKENLSEM